MANIITERCKGCMACKKYCPVNAITGERLLLHHIDPDRCIECSVCGLVCTQSAVINRDGNVIEHKRISAWAKPTFSYDLCVACTICMFACPVGVIEKQSARSKDHIPPGKPFLQTPKGCISCGFCAAQCPTGAIRLLTPGG